MTVQKTWSTVIFEEKDAMIELSINYQTGTYYLTHGSNDQNVTFCSKNDPTITTSINRCKCVMAALKYIQKELQNQQP